VAGFALFPGEVREARRACTHLIIPDPPPPYLQRFLALRLAGSNPGLARKVELLDPDQCAGLFRLVRALQKPGRAA
jgi:hypothetical protein